MYVASALELDCIKWLVELLFDDTSVHRTLTGVAASKAQGEVGE